MCLRRKPSRHDQCLLRIRPRPHQALRAFVDVLDHVDHVAEVDDFSALHTAVLPVARGPTPMN